MKTTNTFYKHFMTLLLTVLMTLVLVACDSTQATDTRAEKDTTNTDGTQEQNSEDKNRSNNSEDKKQSKDSGDKASVKSTADSSSETQSGTDIDADELFSDRDLKQTPDLTDAATITVINGETIEITEAGIYRITGTATDCTIRVDAGLQDKVQLVLDGVTITNTDFPAIYIVSADKCFITTTNTTNSLSVTGAFRADEDTNTDAVIFSREDLTLNGTGTLTVSSAKGNGITCKDDLKVTGGTYNLTSALDTLEANDSIAICGGTFTINSQKDGLHSENDEDNTLGYIFISGGTLTIQAKSDGIQATTFARFDGGTIKITASEGIEATYIEVNDGEFDIYGSDDGFNASKKSKAYTTPTVVFNGGHVKVEVGQGDTDAIDANGDIYVNGGTIEVTYHGMASFDYDGKAEFNGGTIYINGEKVDSIPQSMFGPGGGRGGQGGWGGPGNWGNQNGNNGGNGQTPPVNGGRGDRGNKGSDDDTDDGSNNSGNGQMPNRGGQIPNFGDGQMPNRGGQIPNFGDGQIPNFGDGQMPDFGNGSKNKDGNGGRKNRSADDENGNGNGGNTGNKLTDPV